MASRPPSGRNERRGSDGVSGKHGGLVRTALGCVASALRCREDDTMRRIDDAVGVDPIDFESGYPELV
jgi:hypothetical protein